MTSKLNIFNALPNVPSDEDSDDQGNRNAQGGSKTGGDKVKKDRQRHRGGLKQEGPISDTKQPGVRTNQGGVDQLKSRDQALKQKGKDLDHPHALDRKSGTGTHAYGKNEKKGGYGKFNEGGFKDDLRGPRGDRERGGEDDEPESGDEEDNTLTLDDYINKTSGGQTQQQVNDVKTKITDDQLKKELGKATLLQSRQAQVDDRTETVKKNKITSTVTGMNTEHAELLGFRTGFKVHEKRRPQREERPVEKEGEATGTTGVTEENKQEAGKTEENAPENANKGAEGDQQSPSGQKGGYKGGYKGDNQGGYRGDRNRDDNRGGYRGDRNRDDNRGGYKGEGGYKGDNQGGYRGDRGGNRDDNQGGYKGEGGYKGGNQGGYRGDRDVNRDDNRGGYKGEGGYKGDNQGGYKGDNRGGYKGEGGYKGDNQGGYKGGNQGGYKGGNRTEKKAFNVEDDSLFPKLG